MNAGRQVKLKPMVVPNFVHSQPKTRECGRTFPLREVDSDSLSILCDIFREEVFKKAMKKDPRL